LSLADRTLRSLVRQLATQDVVELVHPFAELRAFGALVYIAECYGFRYVGVRLLGGKHKILHVDLVRDPSPWAQQRAAANAAAFPQPGPGNPLPGMYLGSLTPVPEVDLITKLIKYDAAGAAANRKKLVTMAWAFPLLFLLLADLTGVYVVLLPLAAVIPVFLLGALRINGIRRARLARELAAAGCTPVRDESGRERYVRPVPYGV
jgi:hypothetical protein